MKRTGGPQLTLAAGETRTALQMQDLLVTAVADVPGEALDLTDCLPGIAVAEEDARRSARGIELLGVIERTPQDCAVRREFPIRTGDAHIALDQQGLRPAVFGGSVRGNGHAVTGDGRLELRRMRRHTPERRQAQACDDAPEGGISHFAHGARMIVPARLPDQSRDP